MHIMDQLTEQAYSKKPLSGFQSATCDINGTRIALIIDKSKLWYFDGKRVAAPQLRIWLKEAE